MLAVFLVLMLATFSGSVPIDRVEGSLLAVLLIA
jgi:hypothetical protein